MNDFKLNLQLFNDGFSTSDDVTNPILDDTPVDTPEETPEIDENVDTQGIGEDNNADNDIESTTEGDKGDGADTQPTDIDDDKNTSNDELDGIKSQLNQLLERFNSDQDTEEPGEEPEKELTEEEIEQMNNDFYLKFTEKPLEALEELIEERASKKIEPIMSHFKQMQEMEKWGNTINEFEKKHPDFREYVDDISNLIQNDEGIRNSSNPLETAYKFVKADKLEQKLNETAENSNKPLSELIKEGDSIKELLQNKEIKNMIVKELMNDKNDAPPVVGGKGKTSVTVGDRPKSIEEATKAWLNS